MTRLLLLSLLFLTSCAIYRRTFDCPPAAGVPCTSVTDLEGMIVETNSGPDHFGPLEIKKDDAQLRALVRPPSFRPRRYRCVRVWLAECGQYVYFR